jgi:hypothetical protein
MMQPSSSFISGYNESNSCILKTVTLTEDCPKLYENLYRRESQLLRAYSIAWNLAFFILQYAFVGHAAQRRIYEGPFMSKVFNML